MAAYTIELDCPPGSPRPNALLPGVLKDTGIELGLPSRTFFGCWMWIIPPELEERYVAQQDVIRQRIIELHGNGAIRYGSW